MDKEALKLTAQWQALFLKGWFKDQWYDLLDYLEASLKVLLILLRIIFSPILFLYVVWQTKGIYKQIASGKVNKDQLRGHIKKYGK